MTIRTNSPADVGVLIFAVLLTSLCGIAFQLLASTLTSYLLGSTVTHFSLTIGLFMFFMGMGSYFSKFIEKDLLERFILIEILLGIIGGFSSLLLLASFSLTESYYLAAFILIAAISTCVGMEIPLVLRLVQVNGTLKDAVAHILAVDYIGALFASLLFPWLLLPFLGTMSTAFAMGLLNLSVAAMCLWHFGNRLTALLRLSVFTGVGAFLLCLSLYKSTQLVSVFEHYLYQDPIIYAAQSKYQRLVLTKHQDDVRLFLNGNIQFSSVDEKRYHEPLVYLPLGLVPYPENVLLLGAGDGLAARELLRREELKEITIVDLDPVVTELAKSHPLLRALNKDSLLDPRVKVINQDAYQFLKSDSNIYSLIIADLPDPNDFDLGKLYSKEFFTIVRSRLAADGIFVTQSTSPYFAREPFWIINHTLREVFPHVTPYWSYVPSFGLWGFNMAANRTLDLGSIKLTPPHSFLNNDNLETLFIFDPDTEEIPTGINTLENQSLVLSYENSWKDWN